MDEYEVRQIIRKVKEEEFSPIGCVMVTLMTVAIVVLALITARKIADDLKDLNERVTHLESQLKK